LLCIVSEPTSVGSLTARRIYELAKKLPIAVKEMGVLWNKIDSECPPMEGLSVLARVPEDTMVLEASRRGEDVFALADQCPAFQAVRTMVGRLVAAPHMKQKPKHENQQVLEDR
jgi:CO dehydrogenase nickel-insertion accessory protein CooC1